MKYTKSHTPREVIKSPSPHGRRLLNAITALTLSGLAAPFASAATYTITNDTKAALDWNTAANWTPFAEAQYPGTAADDTAVVREAFDGNVTLDISATPANPLTGLTLGDTAGIGTTTIRSANASRLPLGSATITSSGTIGASNVISAPVLLTGGLTFGTATNPLTISGKITPTAAASRTLTNASTKTVTLGDLDLSTGDTPDIVWTLANTANTSSRYVLAGVIANGGTVPAGLTLGTQQGGKAANTIYQIDGANTYTGTTNLIAGSPQPVTFQLNSNQPFGAGHLNVSTLANAVATFEALNAPRTIPNPTVTLQRTSAYQGENSVTFTGAVSGGSSHGINNNLTGSARLVFNGRYNTSPANTDDARIVNINGTGATLFNGVLADSPAPTADQFGTINLAGPGTVIVNGTATIQGAFRISAAGTVQLGDGGSTGVITPENGKASVIAGGTTGTGSLAVNRGDALTLASTLNGGIGLKQLGAGALTVATTQFHSGANVVGDGVTPAKLIVTAGAVTETTQLGDIATPEVKCPGFNVFVQAITGIDTTALRVGQPVYLEAPGAAVYIHRIDGPTQASVWGVGLTNAKNGLVIGPRTPVKFGAGSSLGTAAATTTVKAHATLAGTGAISGAVKGEDGARFAPGLNTLDADASARRNFGAAGTLTTGPLTLASNTGLDFDLAGTASGASDRIVTSNGNLAFTSLNFTFHGLDGGVLQPGVPYPLITTGTGAIGGDMSAITTAFTGGLAGRYKATYAVNTVAGVNHLAVTFASATAPKVTPKPTPKPKPVPEVDVPANEPSATPTPSSKRKWGVK